MYEIHMGQHMLYNRRQHTEGGRWFEHRIQNRSNSGGINNEEVEEENINKE